MPSHLLGPWWVPLRGVLQEILQATQARPALQLSTQSHQRHRKTSLGSRAFPSSLPDGRGQARCIGSMHGMFSLHHGQVQKSGHQMPQKTRLQRQCHQQAAKGTAPYLQRHMCRKRGALEVGHMGDGPDPLDQKQRQHSCKHSHIA